MLKTPPVKTVDFLPGNQLSVDYRYPIFHRESKKKILLKEFDLIIKAISQKFLCPDTYGTIADSTGPDNMIFRRSVKLSTERVWLDHLLQSYQYINTRPAYHFLA